MNEVQAVPQDQIANVERLLRKYDKTGLYGDVWKFGVNVALRISDLLALQMTDVAGKTELALREGKTGKRRIVTLNPTAQAVIAKRHEANPDDVWLFQSKSNRAKGACKPVTRESVARKFKEVGDVLGFDLSTHSMRKTRGAALYQSGVRIEEICKLLNHSSPGVTMRYIGIDAATVAATYDLEL